MGINTVQWDFVSSCLKSSFVDFSGIKLVELGNQYIRKPLMKKLKWSNPVAKSYFKYLGFRHTSIDINGKDGALSIDLSKPITGHALGQFDILTNSGTTEHVLPFELQHQCFENIHDLVKAGGEFIHILPQKGSFKKHCNVHYTLKFFEYLAQANNYKILNLTTIKRGSKGNRVLVCAHMRKISRRAFNQDRLHFFQHLYGVEKGIMIKKNIEGFPMYLDSSGKGISSTLKTSGAREPCFMWLLRTESAGELGLDVGANIGYTTLSLCATMSRVIAIEPDKRSRKLLKKNLVLNNYMDRTTILDSAVSDKSGVRDIYLAKHPNLTTLCTSRKGSHKKSKINTITIDSLEEDPNFVKMDIEGYEVEALTGGMETWARAKNCKILLEVHPQFYSDEHDFAAVLHKMVELGFEFKYVISAACAKPDLFVEHGYEPFKVDRIGRWTRGIYKDIPSDVAIEFSAYPHKQRVPGIKKKSKKIVRAIMLSKVV